MTDGSGCEVVEEGEAAPPPLTREDVRRRAKAAFDLVQRVCMFGAIKMAPEIAAFLGVPQSRLDFHRLKRIEQRCRRADLARGSLYVDRGLVYGCSVWENDAGFQAGYAFVCREADLA